jgi:Xaa-Pro aminopeptidase
MTTWCARCAGSRNRELAAIRQATEINDIAYEQIFHLLLPGVTSARSR